MPAQFLSAKVTPSGNVLALYFGDGNGNPAAVTAVTPDQITFSVGGGSPVALSNPMFGLGNSAVTAGGLVWFPLGQRFVSIIDQTDPGCVLAGGTWETYAPPSSDLNYSLIYGHTLAYTNEPGATAKYTFTGIIPGRYRISTIWGPGPSNSTHGLAVVEDGAGGPTLGRFPIDFTAPVPFDRGDQGLPWADIGIVTITGTTLVVTISGEDSGYINADAIRIEFVPASPVLASGETVAVHVPGGAVTTLSGVVPDSTVNATFLTDEDLFPFDPASDGKTLRLGYNIGRPEYDYPNFFYANRVKGAQPWRSFAGSGNVDAHGQMTGMTLDPASGKADLYLPFSAGVDAGSAPGYIEIDPSPCTYMVKYRSPGKPTVTILDLGSGAEIAAAQPQPNDPSTGKTVFTQTVTRPTGLNCVGLALRVIGTAPEDYVTDVEILGPEVPADWTSIIHPHLIALLKDHGFEAIRFLDAFTINASSLINQSEFPDPAALSVLWPTAWLYATVTAIGPVDTTAADADDALKFFANNGVLSSWSIVRVTCSSHNFGNYGDMRIVDFSALPNGGGGYADSNGGTTLLGSNCLTVVKDANTLLAVGASSGRTPSGQTFPATLAGTTTVANAEAAFQVGLTVPFQDIIACAVACDVGPWIQVPLLASDDAVTWMAQYAAANTPAGMRCRVEFSNEVWNWSPGFDQTAMAYIKAGRMAADAKAGVPGAYNTGHLRQWYALRMGQVHAIFARAFAAAGRAGDLVRVMAAQGGWAGNTTGPSMSYCTAVNPPVTFDELAIDTYQDNQPTATQYGGSYADCAAAYDRLDTDGLIDVLGLFLGDGEREYTFGSHRQILDAAGAPYTAVRMVSYEGGLVNLCPFASDNSRRPLRSRAAIRNPRIYRAELARNRVNEQAGCTLACRFTLNEPFGMTNGINWQDFVNREGVGTGAPTENPNPEDVNNPAFVSELGGATRYWTSLAIGSPTPIPTPTPAPTPTPTPAPTPAPTPTPTPTPTPSPTVTPTPTPVPQRRKYNPLSRRIDIPTPPRVVGPILTLWPSQWRTQGGGRI